MTADTFLEQFAHLADAPNGIVKVRKLILQLAVRGKLVPQDSDDEPAVKLLPRIERANTEIGAKAKSRSDRDSSEKEALPIGAPSGWESGLLGRYVLFNYGKGIPKDKQQDGDVPVYGANGILRYHNQALVEEPCIVVGRKGSAGAVNRVYEACWPSDVTYYVVPPDGIDFEYCHLMLESSSLGELAKGIKPGLNRSAAYAVPALLPPLAEQKRIVAKVDELMALCDDLETKQQAKRTKRIALNRASLHALTKPNGAGLGAAWHRVRDHFEHLYTGPATIAELRQTILQLAVMGRLVPQDPTDEPASELLKKIQAEKQRLIAEGTIRKPKPLPPIDLDEVPFELPCGWDWARFPELGEFERGKSKHRPRNDPILYRGGTYPLVQTGDVARASGLIETYTGLYNDEGLAQSRLWPQGTMCITIAANIADSAILGFDACFPDSVVGFIPTQCLGNTRYFDYFMRTAKGSLLEYAPSTAQKNINLAILSSVLIPIPPETELPRIVTKVDQLVTICDNLEAKLQRAQSDADNLLAAIVHELTEAGQEVGAT